MLPSDEANGKTEHRCADQKTEHDTHTHDDNHTYIHTYMQTDTRAYAQKSIRVVRSLSLRSSANPIYCGYSSRIMSKRMTP